MKDITQGKTSSNTKSVLKVRLLGLIGAVLIIVVIIGGFFSSDLFAFWKYEGNVTGLIEGGTYIMPLNLFLIRTNGLDDIISSDVYISLTIYIPFMAVAILGLVGSLKGYRKLMSLAGFIGMCVVPISIFVTTRLMATYGITSPGMEWTGLFDYNHVLATGTYTMALWIGFYGCAAGSYLIYLGRPKALVAKIAQNGGA